MIKMPFEKKKPVNTKEEKTALIENEAEIPTIIPKTDDIKELKEEVLKLKARAEFLESELLKKKEGKVRRKCTHCNSWVDFEANVREMSCPYCEAVLQRKFK